MVYEVLIPGLDVGRGEAAEADGEEVHMEEGHLGPDFEGWS